MLKELFHEKILTVLSALMIVQSAFAFPFCASDNNDVDGRTRKFTPEIDGIIDSEYIDSYHVRHQWTKDNSDGRYWAGGRYYYDLLLYGWDCEACSYFLYDDDNIYIAVAVRDDDYGCIDDEHFKLAEDSGTIPYIQDGIIISLTFGEQTATVYADRAGRYMAAKDSEADGLVNLNEWGNGHANNKDNKHFAASETQDGYIIEMRIPLGDLAKKNIGTDGSAFNYGIQIFDSPEDSSYEPTPQEEPKDTCRLKDFVALSDGLRAGSSPSGTIRIELDGYSPLGDTNADGIVNSKDIVHLMTFIAENKGYCNIFDINKDAAVNAKDIVSLMKMCANIR